MFLRLTFSLFILSLSIIFGTNPLGSSGNKILLTERINDNINDTILEFYHNCTCIAYYSYKNIKDYIIDSEVMLKDLLVCSDDNYICFKDVSTVTRTNPNETDSTTPKTTEKPDSTTPTSITSTIESVSGIPRIMNITCGQSKNSINVRILNPDIASETAIPGEFPWMVEIFEKKSKKYKFMCTGSLIHPKVVLTAQHCVRSKEESFKIIANDLVNFQDIGGNLKNERNVFKIIRHPEYYSGGSYNDIALLLLEQDLNYDNSLTSICLPKKNQNFNGKRCLGVGWGQNSDHKPIPLRKVDVPIVQFDECQNLLRKTRLGNYFDLHSSFMCAGGEEGKDTCKGDGGGPLICFDDDAFYQAGIISWGVDVNNCAVANQPGVYTNLSQFRDWINEELDKYSIQIMK